MTIRLSGSYGTWSLPDGEILLGRGKACPLHIPDPRLSRQHARFTVKDAKVAVEDLKSTNGVVVNGAPIQGPTQLNNGDLVSIGPCLLLVAIDPSVPNPKDLEILAQERPVTFTSNNEEGVFDEMLNSATVPAPPAPSKPVRTVATDRSTRQSATDTLKPNEYTPPGTAAVTHSSTANKALPDTSGAQSAQSAEAKAAINAAVRASDLHESPDGRSHALMPDDVTRASGDALQMHSDARRRLATLSESGLNGRMRRIQAGLLDIVHISVVSTLFCAPVAIGSYGFALRQAGAGLADGLPALSMPGGPGHIWTLGMTLLHPGGVARAWELINLLHQLPDHGPFLTLFFGLTLAILVFVLVHLLGTVAATVLSGAPYWHRRLGLVIALRGRHERLDWGRAFVRWFAFAALLPLAPFAVFSGKRGLHDVIAGSEVRLRK